MNVLPSTVVAGMSATSRLITEFCGGREDEQPEIRRSAQTHIEETRMVQEV
jgi:hypothetical protein